MTLFNMKRFLQALERQYEELGERKKDLSAISLSECAGICGERHALRFAMMEAKKEIEAAQ